MSNKDTGGPAFPCSENGTSHTIAMAAMLELAPTATTDEKDKVYIQTKAQAMQGMSLRDYFAGKALDGFMHWALDQPHFTDYDTAAKAAAGYAKSAYTIADAMLAARSA
ncbi:hypothetical protein HUW52_27475 [Pseudomonas sp. 43A]|uniref:hypothetical protein n=1 Tax=unclassified Pseudomonas TaxID=196821 RepID=UPI001587654F|nr:MULTISPECIES: hypothetical protein [unclassified Pseudomonas]QKV66498.1 hypothetical protein HUW52_27475 [Pseudomonas sp. 43A]QMW11049.1 hypothetical protein H3303_05230 [Pseudomonas sp. 29A]